MPNEQSEKKFYTTYEAGELLFVSHSTVIEWINAGKLNAIKTLGGHRRIPKEELELFIKQNKFKPIEDSKPKILVVDDDESIRVGLKELLEDKGFKVNAVSDGFEAGVLAIHSEPSLIILDIKMPGLDGFSACRLIKTNPLLKHIKILVLTGYPSEENFQKIQEFGADRCLAKPVDKKILLKEVNELLGIKPGKKSKSPATAE